MVLCILLGRHTIQPLTEQLSAWYKLSNRPSTNQHSHPRQHYRNSSCSTEGHLAEGYSPSEILNGCQIRSKIDILLPSPAHIAQGKQAKSATKSQLSERHQHVEKVIQTFKIGSPCYALYCGPRREKEPRWVPAVVTKVFGSRSFNVRVFPKGVTWRRHLEQLRPRHGIQEVMIRGILPHVILIPPIPHLKRLTQTLHLVKTCSQKAQNQCQHLRSPLFQNLNHHQTPNLAIHVCLLEETMVPKIYGGQPGLESELGL